MTVRAVSTKDRQVFSFLRSFLCTLLYIKWLHSGSWVLSGFSISGEITMSCDSMKVGSLFSASGVKLSRLSGLSKYIIGK